MSNPSRTAAAHVSCSLDCYTAASRKGWAAVGHCSIAAAGCRRKGFAWAVGCSSSCNSGADCSRCTPSCILGFGIDLRWICQWISKTYLADNFALPYLSLNLEKILE